MTFGTQTTSPLRILVVDDEANIRTTLTLCLQADGHQVIAHGDIQSALDEIAGNAFDLVFLDLRLGMDNGLDFIPRLVRENPWCKVVVITAYASIDTAVEAMKRGASDYLPKPFEPSQVLHLAQQIAERRQLEKKVYALQAALGAMDPEADFPTTSPQMSQGIELARQVAPSRANILIRGEVGTGKSRLARAIHTWSNREPAPFVAVSCRTDAPDVLEAELFGGSQQPGKASFCDGGTLLLDEISDVPVRLQPRLLRLIKDKEYERQDDFTRRIADVRIIAATSIDLDTAVAAGSFRSDLLLALNVIQIDIPPLRQRPGDIPLLAERYLAFFSRENRRSIAGFTTDATHVLAKHSWPGNVRELRNVIERAVLLCHSDLIGVDHLPPNLIKSVQRYSVGDLVPLDAIEELHIRQVVASTRSLRRAATVLGVDSSTLSRRMKRYGVKDDEPAQ